MSHLTYVYVVTSFSAPVYFSLSLNTTTPPSSFMQYCLFHNYSLANNDHVSDVINGFGRLSCGKSFLQTIELPFVAVTYNCPQRYANNYVQLFTTSCVFSTSVRSYVTKGQGVTRRYCNKTHLEESCPQQV